MICPLCGYSDSEQSGYCPRCGRELKFASNTVPGKTARNYTVISPDFLRCVIYLGIVASIFMFFYRLYGFYVSAEQERAGAVLLGQALEHKRRTLEILDN